MGAFKKMKKLFFCLILLQAFALNAFSHEAPQSSDDYYVVDCAYCYKTGRCNICGGSGVVYFMYMSQYCFSCRGYGKCTYCGGAGKVYIKKQAAPAAGYGGGYSGGYSSGSSSSSSSSSSSGYNWSSIKEKIENEAFYEAFSRVKRDYKSGYDISATIGVQDIHVRIVYG